MIGWTMQEEKDMMTAKERIRDAAPDLFAACKELTLAVLAIRMRLGEARDDQEQRAVDELRRIYELGQAAVRKAIGGDL